MNIHATVERHKNTRNMTLMSCLGGTWPGRKTLCNSLVKSNQTQKSTAQKKIKQFFSALPSWILSTGSFLMKAKYWKTNLRQRSHVYSFVFDSKPFIQGPLHGSDSLTGFQVCHCSKTKHVSMGSNCFYLLVCFLAFLIILKHGLYMSLLLSFFHSHIPFFHLFFSMFSFVIFSLVPKKPSWSNTELISCLEMIYWHYFQSPENNIGNNTNYN